MDLQAKGGVGPARLLHHMGKCLLEDVQEYLIAAKQLTLQFYQGV
jgi:hypothetical protein